MPRIVRGSQNHRNEISKREKTEYKKYPVFFLWIYPGNKIVWRLVNRKSTFVKRWSDL